MNRSNYTYLLILMIGICLAACNGSGNWDQGGSKGEPGGMNQNDYTETDGDSESSHSPPDWEDPLVDPTGERDGLYPPMLSDPAFLHNIFGEDQESKNIEFGQSLEGEFAETPYYEAYSFDALPGARVTIQLDLLDDQSGPALFLYGPQAENGLWFGAIKVGNRLSDSAAVIIDFPLSKVGRYLILATAIDRSIGGGYRVSLGCRDQCREPRCPDLTCELYCPLGFLTDVNGCPTCICIEGTFCLSDDDCPIDFSCIDGKCESINKPSDGDCECAAVYDPVCGSDGVTYGNACEAECYGIPISHPGECGDDENVCDSDMDCPGDQTCMDGACAAASVIGCSCPPDFEPVCGVDGRTYSNACELECLGLEMLHDGPCGEEGACRPICWTMDGVEAWVNPCSDQVIGYQSCDGCEALCLFPNSREEGWYSSCGFSLIQHADCAMGCGCPHVWEPVCGADGETYPNRCEAECAGVQTAYFGECTADSRGCRSNTDCQWGQQCTYDDNCDPSDYNLVDGCYGICVDSWGFVECNSDEDCPLGQSCVETDGGGVCVEIEPQGCMVSGCHGEVCSSTPVATDCEWSAEYACYEYAACEMQENGQCGWGGASDTNSDYAECIEFSYAVEGNGNACATREDCADGAFCQEGICLESICQCPLYQSPVCGMDGETYTNACRATCADVVVHHDGACR